MALTTERIRELWENYSPAQGIESFARSIEDEVRRDALEAQAREIEELREDARRAEQLEQLVRYMFEADNDYGAGFSGDPNWRFWYTRLAVVVGVKLESMP